MLTNLQPLHTWLRSRDTASLGHPGQVTGAGEEDMWKAGVHEGAWPLLPTDCAGTQLLPSNQTFFLPKMERCDQMGHLFFLGNQPA